LDFANEFGCRFIITVEGIPLAQTEKEVYVAATSKKLLAEYLEQKATLYKGDRIVGASGILLGLAKMSRVEGICLLGSTSDINRDQETAVMVLKLLRKVLGARIKEGP
jgi:proteasome assembly chaperone (PAC2) family protein